MKKTLTTVSILTALSLCGADEDQIRYNSSYHPHFHDKVKEMGFNLVGGGVFKIGWDFIYERIPPYDTNALLVAARQLEADGICFIPNYNAMNGKAGKKWPRIRKDGTPAKKDKRHFVDAAHPDYQRSLEKGAHAVAAEFARLGLTNFAGFRGVEEVRLHSEPSFTAANAAAYRAFSGRDVPPEVAERAAPHWSKIPGMPESRIVSDDFPVLNYYTWFWRQGDGWGKANDLARNAFQSHFDRPLLSVYAPGLRMPRLGGIGGGNSHLCEWTYLTPVPFVMSYAVAELQANARQTGARVISTVDGVVRRTIVAPFKNLPANLPAWTAVSKDNNYITVPPDYLREGFWLMLSRQTDGIGLSAGVPVFGLAPGERHWACPTNPDAFPILEAGFRDVATPLGPLLRNMPERAPEVAILESYAGALLSGRAHGFWNTPSRSLGYIATAANLAPYALFEEELATNGIPPSVKVICAQTCDVLTDRAAAALVRFRARGGRVLGSATLAPGVQADGQLPDSEAVLGDQKGLRGETTDAEIRTCAAALRRATGLVPYADADNAWLLTFTRTHRDADVVFVVNDKRTAGDYVGQWGRILEKGVPNAGTVTVARAAGAVYDLVRHAPVPFSCADGKTKIPVSFTTTDGRILLLVSKPLGAWTATVRDGALTVTSPDADALLPFGVLDASGKGLRYGILRDGRWTGALPAGAAAVLNLASGEKISLNN